MCHFGWQMCVHAYTHKQACSAFQMCAQPFSHSITLRDTHIFMHVLRGVKKLRYPLSQSYWPVMTFRGCHILFIHQCNIIKQQRRQLSFKLPQLASVVNLSHYFSCLYLPNFNPSPSFSLYPRFHMKHFVPYNLDLFPLFPFLILFTDLMGLFRPFFLFLLFFLCLFFQGSVLFQCQP